jgi:hypothetical protein
LTAAHCIIGQDGFEGVYPGNTGFGADVVSIAISGGELGSDFVGTYTRNKLGPEHVVKVLDTDGRVYTNSRSRGTVKNDIALVPLDARVTDRRFATLATSCPNGFSGDFYGYGSSDPLDLTARQEWVQKRGTRDWFRSDGLWVTQVPIELGGLGGIPLISDILEFAHGG